MRPYIKLLGRGYLSFRNLRLYSWEVHEHKKFYSSTVSGIKMADTIKANRAENGFFQKWTGYQAAANTSIQQLIKVMVNFGRLSEFIVNVTNIIIIALGVLLAMNDDFTLGMIMTFQGLMTTFILLAQTLIESCSNKRKCGLTWNVSRTLWNISMM